MHSPRTNNFNFIRLVLALLVLLAHAPEMVDGNRRRELLTVVFRGNFSFGEIAVGGFFMLSGYLILKSWLNEPDAIKFLKKRIRRIFPAFIIASLVCALIIGPLGAQSTPAYFSNLRPFDFLWGMLTLGQPVIPPVFIGQPYPLINGAMWTIPIEFACYLGILFTGLVFGYNRAFVLAATLALLGICAAKKFGYESALTDLFSLHLAAYFAVGCCFYLFRNRIRYTKAGALLCAVLLLVGLHSYRVHQLVFSLAGAYLLFFVAFANIRPLANFGTLPDVSYGAYLYGWPIQKLLLWWFPGSSPWIIFVVSAILAIAAGWASWNIVEKKFIASKEKLIASPSEPSPLILDAPSKSMTGMN